MKRLVRNLAVPGACGLALTLAACSRDTETRPVTQQDGVQCIELAEGSYVFENGQFIATSLPPQKPAEAAPEKQAQSAWARQLEEQFADAGFPWMGVRSSDGVAVLIGIAPDLRSKERAFAAGQTAVTDKVGTEPEVSLIVDGISIADGEHAEGDGLAGLMESRVSVAACQKAFDETMQGRQIIFQSNLAIVSPVSTRLLDALTGVSRVCSAYEIAIASHTDSRGSDEYNRIISQQRADAVKDYMVRKGVPAESLKPLGYGETDPIDPQENEVAWARNRRTEFRVAPRS